MLKNIWFCSTQKEGQHGMSCTFYLPKYKLHRDSLFCQIAVWNMNDHVCLFFNFFTRPYDLGSALQSMTSTETGVLSCIQWSGSSHVFFHALNCPLFELNYILFWQILFQLAMLGLSEASPIVTLVFQI